MTAGKRIAIRAGYVIAFDGEGHRLLRDGVVVIEGDSILHVGPRFDGRVDETVDASDRVLTPGLISTHAHISGSPLDRSFIEDCGNPQFWFSGLFEMLPVRSDSQDEEAGRACVDFSMAELLRGGVTTVMEIGTPRRVRGRARAALRPARLHGAGLPLREVAHARRQARGVGVERGAGAAGARARHRLSTSAGTAPTATSCAASSSPSQIDTCTPELLQDAKRFADEVQAARTRCTPRSRWSSSTRWCPPRQDARSRG